MFGCWKFLVGPSAATFQTWAALSSPPEIRVVPSAEYVAEWTAAACGNDCTGLPNSGGGGLPGCTTMFHAVTVLSSPALSSTWLFGWKLKLRTTPAVGNEPSRVASLML